jgi:ABC-2 type transport system ATP-binding protein
LTTHYLEEAEALADRVGIMNDGNLLQVEEVDSLIRNFGTRSLRIKIGTSLETLPDSLTSLGCSIGSHQQEICYPIPPHKEEIQPVLDNLNALGLKILDISEHRSNLEDVFRYLIGNSRDEEKLSQAERKTD